MKEYKVGDTVYIAVGCKDLVKGKIIHVFDYGVKQYVVEYYAVIDYALVVRDWSTVSDTKEGPLNLWESVQKFAKRFKEQKK